jgi:hypothetical protein
MSLRRPTEACSGVSKHRHRLRHWVSWTVIISNLTLNKWCDGTGHGQAFEHGLGGLLCQRNLDQLPALSRARPSGRFAQVLRNIKFNNLCHDTPSVLRPVC